MSDYNRNYAQPAIAADMSVDAGLRGFMLGVYNKLAIGLVVSAAMSLATGYAFPELLFRQNAAGGFGGYTGLGWVIALAPLAVLLLGGGMARSVRGASTMYWLVVALIGASMGAIFLRYSPASIATTFFATSAAFGALSLFGYTTKKDISGWGSFLIIGLIGVIIASIVNMFLASPALYFIISGVGVLVFAGLIAYDTQRLKMTYYQLGGDEAALGMATSFGALTLYLNFINLFQFLLAFMGNRE